MHTIIKVTLIIIKSKLGCSLKQMGKKEDAKATFKQCL